MIGKFQKLLKVNIRFFDKLVRIFAGQIIHAYLIALSDEIPFPTTGCLPLHP
jgi:hypothetical protein